MKRALTLGFAAFALAAAVSFSKPASAAPSCTTFTIPPQTDVAQWPLNGDSRTKSPQLSFMYNCVTSDPTSDFASIWQAAQWIGTDAGTGKSTALAQLFTVNHVRIYFVNNISDLNTIWGTNYPTPTSPTVQWGTTMTVAGSKVPLYASAVFLNPPNLGKAATNRDVRGVIMHELGHDYDLIYGSPSVGSLRYLTALNMDINTFNSKPQNVVFKTGIAKNCQGAGQTNYQILQCEFDQAVGGAGELESADKEAWANFFGAFVGNSVNYWLDDPQGHGSDFLSAMSTYFPNVQAYMVGLRDGSSPY